MDTVSDTTDEINKKGSVEATTNPIFIMGKLMVPRDRIELPTRGFSVQIFEKPNML